MKVIIGHRPNASGAGSLDTICDAARRWLNELHEEHKEHYGAPHGAGDARRAGRYVEAAGLPVWVEAGYIDAASAARIIIKAVEELVEDQPGAHDGVADEITHMAITGRSPGMAAIEGAPVGGWMSSAGNITLVVGPYEFRWGRRHGVRLALLRGLNDRVGYLDTARPDASPDECGLGPEPEPVTS